MTGKAAGSPAHWRYAGDRERSQGVLARPPRKRGAPRSVSIGYAPAGPCQRKETLDTRYTGGWPLHSAQSGRIEERDGMLSSAMNGQVGGDLAEDGCELEAVP
jgi:hypothetical protein